MSAGVWRFPGRFRVHHVDDGVEAYYDGLGMPRQREEHVPAVVI